MKTDIVKRKMRQVPLRTHKISIQKTTPPMAKGMSLYKKIGMWLQERGEIIRIFIAGMSFIKGVG